ncbi:MAG TPA: ascorbate-dependent monooxygenase [Thermoanaerobaculia bacterium]|nr:ascorbate-dependent monooxygenase [Thermoanaerobaculia bacterium]
MKRVVALSFIAAVALMFIGARQRAVVHPAVPQGPTFSNEVVRIFQSHCQTCHHPGDIAPFSLMDYTSAKPEAFNIRSMVQTHQMPPWKPVQGCEEFAEARGPLPQSDIDTIVKWVNNGAPEGDPKNLPTPIDFSSGWTLGQPDLVLTNPDPYTPPATGDMYRCFTLPTNLPADTYVSAIDIHPGDRASVHHVIAYIDTSGDSVNLDANDPGPGYTSFGGPGFTITNPNASSLGGWAPGMRALNLPSDIAFLLPANSRVVLQVHYHPHDGAPKADQTSIGIYFAKQKPKQILRILPLVNDMFTIPPNDPAYQVSASFTTPVAAHLWLIAPHMHLLGRKMNVNMTFGSQQSCLINIDDWDFNWQGIYRFVNPVPAFPFTTFKMTATFDNSDSNPRNPNFPPKPVSWGESTTDEMAIAFIGFTIDGENLATGQMADASWVPSFPSGSAQ